MNDTVDFKFISASKLFLLKLVCFQHSNFMQSVALTFDKNFESDKKICQKVGLAVLSCLGCHSIQLPEGSIHLPWSLTSNNCSAPGQMFDNLLPIPDAEYHAFYPIGIRYLIHDTSQHPKLQA